MNARGLSRCVLAFGLALSASACDWPQAGTGGLAERQPALTPAIEAVLHQSRDDPAIGNDSFTLLANALAHQSAADAGTGGAMGAGVV